MSLNDQFKQMGRLPLKPLAYSKRDLAQCNEILIDYDGDERQYHIYIVDSNDRTKLIDLSQVIIEELFPNASINANNFKINIEGDNPNPDTLQNIINFIYKRFLMPDDPHGFDYAVDKDKVFDPTTKSVLLKDTDGIIYLPVTTTDNIITRDGQTLKDKLDNMTRVGFSTDYIVAEEDGQTTFEITYPFPNYSKQGNYVEVRIGSVYVDKSRYQIIDSPSINDEVTNATLIFDEPVKISRAVNLLFIYNYRDIGNDVTSYIYGGMLINKSIPTTKLEKISDSYITNDSTSVASSKALYNLYNDLTDILAKNSGHYLLCNDESASNDLIIVTTYEKITIDDGFIFEVALQTNKKFTCKFKINGRQFDIYNVDGSLNKYQLPGNKLVKFILKDGNIYVVGGFVTSPSMYIHTCVDQENEVYFSGLSYTLNDRIFVYRNGVRLFEGLDYTMDAASEKIILHIRAEDGERIVFEAM